MQNTVTVHDLKRYIGIKPGKKSDRQNGQIKDGKKDQRADFDSFRNCDAAQAEYAQHDEENQKTSADIYDPHRKQRTFKPFGQCEHHIPEIHEGDHCEYEREVHIKMLVPLCGINICHYK
jgi:hypothetical protein